MSRSFYAKQGSRSLCVRNRQLVVGTASGQPDCVCGGSCCSQSTANNPLVYATGDNIGGTATVSMSNLLVKSFSGQTLAVQAVGTWAFSWTVTDFTNGGYPSTKGQCSPQFGIGLASGTNKFSYSVPGLTGTGKGGGSYTISGIAPLPDGNGITWHNVVRLALSVSGSFFGPTGDQSAFGPISLNTTVIVPDSFSGSFSGPLSAGNTSGETATANITFNYAITGLAACNAPAFRGGSGGDGTTLPGGIPAHLAHGLPCKGCGDPGGI